MTTPSTTERLAGRIALYSSKYFRMVRPKMPVSKIKNGTQKRLNAFRQVGVVHCEIHCVNPAGLGCLKFVLLKTTRKHASIFVIANVPRDIKTQNRVLLRYRALVRNIKTHSIAAMESKPISPNDIS